MDVDWYGCGGGMQLESKASLREKFRHSSIAEKKTAAQAREDKANDLVRKAHEKNEDIARGHGHAVSIAYDSAASKLMWVDNPDLSVEKRIIDSHLGPCLKGADEVDDLLRRSKELRGDARYLRWSARKGQAVAAVKRLLHLK